MVVQLAVSTRNARLDAIETDAGTAAILKIRTGAQPADCAAADTGTVLATLNLPSDWMAAASGGTKAKSGTWQDTAADAAGTAAHWRLYKSDGTTCIAQGTVGQGSGDLSLDNVVIAVGQVVTVTAWTFTDGNA
jgi:hypothetical protein